MIEAWLEFACAAMLFALDNDSVRVLNDNVPQRLFLYVH